MGSKFPSAVPEIPVEDMGRALAYYEEKLGFTVDWGRDGGGIAGISQGRSRIFLTDQTIRNHFRNEAPVVVWLNLGSKEEVDQLHERWCSNGAKIVHPPESKSWSRLHEFVAQDPDGNFIRAFYNFQADLEVLEVPKHVRCPFCAYIDGADRCAFVSRSDRVSSFMNRAQFERGALLVVPNEHRETILELDSDLVSSVYREAQRIAGGVVNAFGAVGVNIFQNSGVRAGQSVAHFHVHVVPRYESSQPWRFHEVDVDHTPIDELEEIASELRAALSA